MSFRLTLRHRHSLGPDGDLVGKELAGPQAWDRLRMESAGAFGLSSDVAAWQEAATRTDIRERAEALDVIFRERKIQSIASYGVGTALVELNLLDLDPARSLTLTEFAPGTVDRLKKLASEMQPAPKVVCHDLVLDLPLPVDIHLFHRIDTELDDDTWHGVFQRFAGEQIVVVATQVIGPRQIASALRHRLLMRSSTVAGWMRSRGAFEALWKDTHTSRMCSVPGAAPAWWLSPKTPVTTGDDPSRGC